RLPQAPDAARRLQEGRAPLPGARKRGAGRGRAAAGSRPAGRRPALADIRGDGDPQREQLSRRRPQGLLMELELGTSYMGLQLRNPLVASASPLSYTLDGVRRLADSGVGAIVLFSLFEEQLREEEARRARIVDGPAESFPEALDYVPAVVKDDAGPSRYLSLIERAAAAVDIPVIASLNAVTPEGL